MLTISGGGSFTRQNIQDINANFSTILPFTPGNLIYLNPSSPNLNQPPTGSVDRPYTDLLSAYGAGRSGKNDVIVLVGNGAATGTARLSAAFTWSKSALHLIGIAPPGLSSQRARIAPTSGATAFANFFTVSGSGCLFQNIQWYQGFGTGTTSQICMTVTGSYNAFLNCHFAGMADAESANSTGSRNLKIGSAGSGENYFQDCTIGVDTIARTAANAGIELAGATPRNVFRRCNSLVYATGSGSGAFHILGTGNGCVDRINEFDDCGFFNSIKSGSGTAMTAAGSFTTNAPGGLIVFKKCMTVGTTKWGDANFLANSYIDMAAPSSAAGGLAVNPA